MTKNLIEFREIKISDASKILKWRRKDRITNFQFTDIENLRYAGSRISAPAINIASIYPQLNYEPIIEVFAVNPNQLIFNETPPEDERGTLRVQ